MVAAKRRQMAAERAARAVRRRVRNEIARALEYVRQHPGTNGYSEALAREQGSASEVAIYRHGPVPEPYTLALGEIVARRADGTPVRLPEGANLPAGYTLAFEARRSGDRNTNDN